MAERKANLSTDPEERKNAPVYTGFMKYFPKAIVAVANLSRVCNEQHNPGSPVHWDRNKSGDELDSLGRHLLEAEEVDVDGELHATKVAWRAMANLEKLLEAKESKPDDRTIPKGSSVWLTPDDSGVIRYAGPARRLVKRTKHIETAARPGPPTKEAKPEVEAKPEGDVMRAECDTCGRLNPRWHA